MNQTKQNTKIGMSGTCLGLMTVSIAIIICLRIDQIIVFCEENNNRIIFSKVDTGAFVKSFTVCEEVTTYNVINMFTGSHSY